MGRTYLAWWVLYGIFSNQLHLHQLYQLGSVLHADHLPLQILQRSLVAHVDQGDQGIPLARLIGLGLEEVEEQIGGIGNKALRVLMDGRYRQDGILPYVGVAVL